MLHVLTSSEFAEVSAKSTLLCLCKPGLGQAAPAHPCPEPSRAQAPGVSQGHWESRRDTWQVGGQVVSEHRVHRHTHSQALCTHSQPDPRRPPPWNALTFFPLRRKVFKQMLLQKKKNVTALQATALPVSNFQKK